MILGGYDRFTTTWNDYSRMPVGDRNQDGLWFERTYDLASMSHDSLTVSMHYIAVDNWHGEEGWIKVDGQKVWSYNYADLNTNRFIEQPDWDGQSSCGNGDADLRQYVSVTIPHSANSATIRVGSDLQSWGNHQSFALDNVAVVPCTKVTSPVYNPTYVKGVIKNELAAGQESTYLLTDCCMAESDCSIGHTCKNNICMAEYAMAYDFRHELGSECTNPAYLTGCEADTTCASQLDAMTACGPLPGTPPVPSFPSEGEMKCAEGKVTNRWGPNDFRLRACSKCQDGTGGVADCFACCDTIQDNRILASCCEGACCDLKLANEAEALCTVNHPDWHDACYRCNSRNDEYDPVTNTNRWLPERFPDTDGYNPSSIGKCGECGADLPTLFPQCCRGGACPATTTSMAESTCMIAAGNDEIMHEPSDPPYACQACEEFYSFAPSSEMPTYCEQCCELMKSSSQTDCCSGQCCNAPVTNAAELACSAVTNSGDTDCTSCATDITITGYCAASCTGNAMCATGQTCVGQVCTDSSSSSIACAASSECTATQICHGQTNRQAGTCKDVTWCTNDASCTAPESCQPVPTNTNTNIPMASCEVSFQWKNPDFLLKNPDFLIRNPKFL